MASRRAWAAFAGACAFTSASVGYVHWAQENDRVTMYQNVLNDIREEEAEKAQAAAPAGQGASSEDCPTGICDLKQTRTVGQT